MKEVFHPLQTSIAPPERMNNPFFYKPHPLCLLAAEEVKGMIAAHEDWKEEVGRGKMFGVLIVERTASNEDGERMEQTNLGFLAAYSGQIGGRSDWEGFVPAVFDYLQPDGYFKQQEAEIDQLNREVERLTASTERLRIIESLNMVRAKAEKAIARHQAVMKAAKMLRDQRRREALLSEREQHEMIRESQFQKAELHRMKQRFSDEIEKKEQEKVVFDKRIQTLKHKRKEKSDDLQRWLFSHFEMLNKEGERRNLLEIFSETALRVPPAGAGECCEPKLLQYAYAHGLRPLCMAMFWWGASPKGEVRHHGQFYPACSGKCKPILTWMLDLRKLEKEMDGIKNDPPELPIVYEDDDILVVNKPAGILSVPGIDAPYSVCSIIRERYPDLLSPLMVHRLDMSTSGLLVLAKTKEAHWKLQQQFEEHTVSKQYRAILDGEVHGEGIVDLPLRPDLLDRPRQVVDYENGKRAVTRYRVDKVEDGKTWITLFPETGRTHQLRVHCAHQDGLNCPILGDPIYGRNGNELVERMYLHAERLELTHPTTGKRIVFIVKSEEWRVKGGGENAR